MLSDAQLREIRDDYQSRGPVTGTNREYTSEERIFLVTLDRYKRVGRRPFPTWLEVLALVHALGYRQTQADQPAPDPGAQAQREPG